MRNILGLSLAGIMAFPAAAAAEAGRFAAIKAIVENLAVDNPNADSSYWAVVSYTLPRQLAKCRFNHDDMDFMDRLLAIFEEERVNTGYNSARISERVRALSEFQKPEEQAALGQLIFGIMVAPDMTRAALAAESCRALVRENYDGGLTRRELLEQLPKLKLELDTAAAPR